jgi:hypothetical protein
MGHIKIKKIFPLLLFFIFPVSVFGATTINFTPNRAVLGDDITIYINGLVGDSESIYIFNPNGIIITDWDASSNIYLPETNILSSWLDVSAGVGQYRAIVSPKFACNILEGDFTYEECLPYGTDYGVFFTVYTVESLFYGGSATALVASIGEVSGSVFNGALPYFLLSMGVFIAFYILQQLIMIQPKPEKSKKDRIIRDKEGKQIGIDVSNDGYHRVTGKKGQEIGWEKD